MKIIKTLFIFIAMVTCYNSNATDAAMPQAILKHINAYRLSHHLTPLKMNAYMSLEAQQHSQDMARHRQGFGHTGFKKRIHRCFAQFHRDSYGPGAENVAYNYKTAAIVVSEWLKSPGHLANIRGNYNETGIGIARDANGKIYYTEIFLRKT